MKKTIITKILTILLISITSLVSVNAESKFPSKNLVIINETSTPIEFEQTNKSNFRFKVEPGPLVEKTLPSAIGKSDWIQFTIPGAYPLVVQLVSQTLEFPKNSDKSPTNSGNIQFKLDVRYNQRSKQIILDITPANPT